MCLPVPEKSSTPPASSTPTTSSRKPSGSFGSAPSDIARWAENPTSGLTIATMLAAPKRRGILQDRPRSTFFCSSGQLPGVGFLFLGREAQRAGELADGADAARVAPGGHALGDTRRGARVVEVRGSDLHGCASRHHK